MTENEYRVRVLKRAIRVIAWSRDVDAPGCPDFSRQYLCEMENMINDLGGNVRELMDALAEGKLKE